MHPFRLATLPAGALVLAVAFATSAAGSPGYGHGHGHGHGHWHQAIGGASHDQQDGRGGGSARDDAPDAATVSVTGRGESTVSPDIAVVTVGVTVQAPSAAEAMRQNTERQQVIIDTLKSRGIEARDIQTSGLNLNPVQDYSREGKPPVVTGYQATNLVTVRVRQLPQLGEALDALVGAGANEINGISFQRESIENAEGDARARAVENARLRAEIIANAAGMDLGRLVSIDDRSVQHGPQPMMRAMAMESAADSAPVPIEAGELSVAAEVSVTWELRPARRDGAPSRARHGRGMDRGKTHEGRSGIAQDHRCPGAAGGMGQMHGDGMMMPYGMPTEHGMGMKQEMGGDGASEGSQAQAPGMTGDGMAGTPDMMATGESSVNLDAEAAASGHGAAPATPVVAPPPAEPLGSVPAGETAAPVGTPAAPNAAPAASDDADAPGTAAPTAGEPTLPAPLVN